MGIIIEAVGSRAFGPLLLLVGIILVSPLSGIPGMPTFMGVFVLLIAVQLLLRRRHFWLPRWLLNRTVSRTRLNKSLTLLRHPAHFIDRFLQPRLELFIRGVGHFVVSVICMILAISLPLMEVVPFSATSAGIILTVFGLSLSAHDGFLALFAFVLTTVTFIFIVMYLL